MTSRPQWWGLAEDEIDGVIINFVEGQKDRLAELSKNPKLLISRRNLFLLRMQGSKQC